MCVDDEVLNTYLDGELKEPWKTQVEQHLAYCSACRSRMEQMKGIDATLKASTLENDVIKEREEKVFSYLEKSRLGRKKVSFFRRRVQIRLIPALVTSAAAFVIVFIGAFVMFGTSSRQTEEILPGVAAPLDSANVRQVSDVKPASLDDYSLEQIVQYLDSKGYAVKLELKAVEPIEQ